MAKTVGIIQARMGSERLPGKILAPLAGRPLLDILFARIGTSRVDEWWLATSSDPADDVTEAWGFELGLRVFRGDANDVLSRFTAIGAETQAEWIVRVTADNPFLDAPAIDLLLDARDASEDAKGAELIEHRSGLVIEDTKSGAERSAAQPGSEDEPAANDARVSPGFPVGYGVQLVRRSALERAAEDIPNDQFHHRVHVTSWLANEAEIHDVATPADWPSRPDWRWTVDAYEDLAMARSAFKLFGLEASTIDYPTMVARLDAHPEIAEMNQHIRQKELEEG